MRARHNSQVDSSEDVNMDSPNDVTSGPSCTTAVSPSLLRMELFLPLIHLCLGHVFNVFNLLLNYLPPFHNFRRYSNGRFGPWSSLIDCLIQNMHRTE